MALQGFDKSYFLPQALAQLQTMDVFDDIFQGQNVVFLEEQLAANNLTAEDLYSGWGWKYGLQPNQYFDPDYYMLALAKWAVDNNALTWSHENLTDAQKMTQARMAVANALAGQDPYQFYLQLSTMQFNDKCIDINPSAAFDESEYIESLFTWAQANASSALADLGIVDAEGLRLFFNENGVNALVNYMDYGRMVNIVPTPVSGEELVGLDAGTTIHVDSVQAAGADVMRLTGDQDVRIDFTNPANQITGLDLDGSGYKNDNPIESDGFENNISGLASNYEIVDAYARNPLNHNDIINNFLGDIAFDGTGFDGDGVNTDGNIFLGGLGVDTALGGIGNDFLAGGGVAQNRVGRDELYGGRNADFFFASLSKLSATDGDSLLIDGDQTTDDSAVTGDTAMDADWLLLEVADDEDGTVIDLADTIVVGDIDGDGDNQSDGNGQLVQTGEGTRITMSEVEHVDASGNLYGFINDMNTTIGEGAGATHTAGEENSAYGATSQLLINGSGADNILIGGYDNDQITGGAGNDIIMGGNLAYLVENRNNPNLLYANGEVSIVNDGADIIAGGANDDNIAFEADGGAIDGGADTDTLWLTEYSLGTQTAATMTRDGVLRFDLDAQNLANAAGYGGADVDGTQDQTNYADRTDRVTVTNMENVFAAGLGDIDYLAAGTNDPELNFNNQQNFYAYKGDLDLRGENDANVADALGNRVVDNALYASNGNDVLEGRGGNDNLMGNEGNDDFIFALDGDNAGDDLDIIHRQTDAVDNVTGAAGEDNLWDVDSNGNVLYGRDFLLEKQTDVEASSLVITIDNTDTFLMVAGVLFWVDGTQYSVDLNDNLHQATNMGEIVDVLNDVLYAENPNISVSLGSGTGTTAFEGQIVITVKAEEGATEPPRFTESGDVFNPDSVQVFLNTSDSAAASTAEEVIGGTLISGDRLIFASYEDRLDGELVDDDSYIGSTISLGADAYAEDLVVDFAAADYDMDGDGVADTDTAGTKLAEDQKYRLDFTNLADEDTVTVDINGVKYTLQVGVALDGTRIEDETTEAFIIRFAKYINNFLDDDTASGKISALAPSSAGVDLNADGDFTDPNEMPIGDADQDGNNSALMFITQNTYKGEETVFMRTPVVTIESGRTEDDSTDSNGEPASVVITNETQTEVHLLDFDGRNGLLNEDDVRFIGNTGINRSVLQTALTEGGELKGSDAVVVHVAQGTLITGSAPESLDGEEISYNQSPNLATGFAENFAIHGDDLLIGADGADEISGGTGDDRIHGSRGQDVLDGGKNLYLQDGVIRVYNEYEAALADADPKTISIELIEQTESGDTAKGLVDNSGIFDDTLIFQQKDFGIVGAGGAEFYITLDTDPAFPDGGAGTVEVTEDGAVTGNTDFTNFENVRTVSGDGTLAGQGNDTLDVSALSTSTGGIRYYLDNSNNAGLVQIDSNKTGFDPQDSDKDGDTQERVWNKFFSVDGVENVIGGNGEDVLVIDETEAGKNNKFIGNEDTDTIEYSFHVDINDNGMADVADNTANPQMTLIVNAEDDIDHMDMTLGLVGLDKPRDILDSVEIISLGDAAHNPMLDDTLDVTHVEDAVVDFVNGEVRSGADMVNHLDDEEVIINSMSELEIVKADGNDTVIVSDAMANIRISSDQKPITFDTFLNYDMLDNIDNKVPARMNIGELRSVTADALAFPAADKTADEGDIPEIENMGLFEFQMGQDNDTVDYSNESGLVVAVVNFDENYNVDQDSRITVKNVLVSNDNDTDFTDDSNRVDVIADAENFVASKGTSILDLTQSNVNLMVRFNADDGATSNVDELDRDVFRVSVSQLDSSSQFNPFAGLNFLEYFDAGKYDSLADNGKLVNQPTAAWNIVEGSDQNEKIELTDHETDEDHEFNLRGGENEVNYNELTKSIITTIGITDYNAAAPATTGIITAEIIFTDGKGNAAENIIGGMDTATSYTAQNAIAKGSLRIEASQNKYDTIAFAPDVLKKAFIIGEEIDGSQQITVKLGTGENANTLELTGYEYLTDAATDDFYTVSDLKNSSLNLVMTDNLVDDRDTIIVGDDAVDFGDAGADEISLAAINKEFKFDFDVLDISAVKEDNLTITGDTSAARDTDEDEVVLGDLNNIDVVTSFDVISLSKSSSTSTYFNFNLVTTELQDSKGATLLNFDGDASALDLSRVEKDLTVVVTDNAATDVKIIGGSQNDTITGGAGDDFLGGNAGNDVVNAGVATEVRQFNLTGVLNSGAGNAAFNFMGQNHLTLTEGTDFAAGAGNDAVGAAIATKLDNNLAMVNTDFRAVSGGTEEIVDVSYDDSKDLLTFTFKSGVDITQAINLGYAANGDTGTFAVSSENVVSNGGNGGNNTFYGGQGFDTLNGGIGDDVFVVVGVVDASDYAVGAAKNSAAVNFQAAVDAIEEGQAKSDLTVYTDTTTKITYRDVISGGEGDDTIEVWGDADFTSSVFTGIEFIDIHSTVTFNYTQISGITFSAADPDSKIIIIDAAGVANTYTDGDTIDTNDIADLNAITVPPDTTLPKLVAADCTPRDNASDVAVASDIKLVFDEDVVIADEDGIVLYNAAGTVIPSVVTVADDTVTINPDSNLVNGTDYYVMVSSTAIKDEADNFYAGIADKTSLNFKTVASASETEDITSGNTTPYDASVSAVTFNLNAGNYIYNIDKFAAGDKLVFPVGADVGVKNFDYSDSAVTLTWANGTNLITVNLTGITNDSSLDKAADFNTVFGAGTINTGSVTPPVGTATVAVTGASTSAYDATAKNTTFNIASGTYTYEISGFAAGDVLDFPAGADASVKNFDHTDNALTLTWALGGNVVTISLIGLAAGMDQQLNSVSDFNTVLGAGTII